MKIHSTITAVMLFGIASLRAGDFRLHGMFGDHMVLQRDTPMPVYGEGKPGARVIVKIGDASLETLVSPDGKWQVMFPAFPAGGPHTLEATADEGTARLQDIFIGDVWIASGQSNMEWKVGSGIVDSDKEIAGSNVPKIRFFNVPKRQSDMPETDVQGAGWQVASPQTIRDCSAVAWFFAREVFRETNIPIGIVNSSVGGTPVEAWMSSMAMQRFPNPKQPMLDALNAKYGTWTKHIEENERNIRKLMQEVDQSMKAVDAGVLTPGFDDSAWTEDRLFAPPPAENCLRWLRRKVTLTAEQAAAPMILSLARPDIKALIHINGRMVADLYEKDCRIELPANTFHAGENLIVIRLANYWGRPQFVGREEKVFLASKDEQFRLLLMSGWKYSDAMEPPLTKWLPMGDIPSSLFNGMIHPLLRSPIKGAIWYQGESNAVDPAGYAVKFPMMISDWRLHFSQGYFPFFFVQLANYGAPSELPSQEGWPLLREAQQKALLHPNTGMATAIDVGDPYDIHPKNKQDVGRRLALLALKSSYGKPVESSGPVYQDFKIQGNKLVLRFDHAAGMRTTDNLAPKCFSIAGADRVFYPAKATIDGEAISLSSERVPSPVAARYAFSASPVVNLINAAGLPAYPFRTDPWDQISTKP